MIYVVAYSYQDKFDLEEKEATALIAAKEQGMSGIRSGDKYLSTNFMWIMPKEETQTIELNSDELKLCEQIAEWLSRDINGLEWSTNSALKYSKKLIKRIGYDKVADLWHTYANGAYPSVRKFLNEAKQTSDLDEPLQESIETINLLD